MFNNKNTYTAKEYSRNKYIFKIIKIVILGVVVLVILLSLLLLLPRDNSLSRACFKEECFEVEIADSPDEQERGLMFYESLKKNKGMLFVFEEEGDYPFWMMNTLIPLDIIWINSSREIVFISENAQPCPPLPEATDGQSKEVCEPIDPKQNAKYVLEINGGLVGEKNIKVGDKLSIIW